MSHVWSILSHLVTLASLLLMSQYANNMCYVYSQWLLGELVMLVSVSDSVSVFILIMSTQFIRVASLNFAIFVLY